MSKIKVMTPELSNRIAAGEVIERPASVVKELVENAIDAGATGISIEIERAGSRLISVTDNGCGMDADDALLCIEPHGTSKLLTSGDMEHITTLGFRGEAIPSIASVSRFSLTTRTHDALEATRVEVEGGKLKGAAPSGGPVGSCVQIRDLFFNTPARKKFLKSPATENHHIEEMILSLAIPRPEIAFSLTMDGRRVFTSPASETHESRLREFFGKPFAENLWPVEYHEGGMTITGYTAAPGFTRNSRKEQRTFVNKRAVEAAAFFRGIREGYATLTEHGRYSPAVLFLEMPVEDVDVNVHPAKREVRFKHEYAVTRAVCNAIGHALKRSRETVPVIESRPRPALFSEMPDGTVPMRLVLDSAAVRYTPAETEQPELIKPQIPEPEPESEPEIPPPELHLTDRPAETGHAEDVPQENTITEIENTFDFPDAPFSGVWPTEIIGVFENTYILASGGGNLILIDQHAAHERVLFEKLLASFRHGGDSQPLLLPQTLELPLPMTSLLLRNRKIFEQLGFDFEPLGSNTLMINALPQLLPMKRPLTEMIPDMLEELLENAGRKIPPDPGYIARAACRAAVKAHDILPVESIHELLGQLRSCRQGTLCPHGRPTMITITLKELEKRFFRR